MKKLAIIGKPNVGKSSFFNRLLKARDAITSEQAGTTRDIKKRVVQILDKEVEVLDTGGLDSGNELFDAIKKMSIKAAKSADIILYMVDGKSLPEEDDKKFFYELEASGKKIALVVNKIDNDKMMEKTWEYYEFGTENIFPISVSHNRHINKLLEWIAEQLPQKEEIEQEVEETKPQEEEFVWDDDFSDLQEKEDRYFYTDIDENQYEEGVFDHNDMIKEYDKEAAKNIRVAIIGRVNVGKSSLLNALLGQERSVVSNVAGTTIDPIDEEIEYEDRKITFIDTAGVRKRGEIVGIERYALMRTKKMLDNADIALLVLDASQPFLDLDEKIAGLIDSNRLGCIIVLNKWDIADSQNYDKIVQEIRGRFKFLHYAPIITISAMTKHRVHKISEMLLKINASYSQHITTSKLNAVMDKALRRHQLPSVSGQVIRIYYATQYETRPPRIALIMNNPKGLHFTYRRYLTNKLREAFDFEGVPLLFKARKK